MDSNEQLVEQIVKFRGSSEITCPHIAGVMLRQDCSRCWAEFIRSYIDALVAAAYENCAQELDDLDNAALAGIAIGIRKLTPGSARRALELREVKAKIDEAKDYTIVVRAMVESPRAHKRCLKECEQHLADLERRREELEGEKHDLHTSS